MTAKPEVYFGACDRQMETYLDQRGFDEALVFGLLFHGDLLVMDVFFFISSNLKRMILDDRLANNFVTAGLRNGAIIPAFRTEGTESFRQSFDEIDKAGIQGLHKLSKELADTLDRGLTGKRLYSKTWPKQPLSVGYKHTLERTLFSANVENEFPLLKTTWSQMRDIRDAVIAAIRYDSLGGIRRGDLYNLVHLHLNGEKRNVEDVSQIWGGIAESHTTLIAQRFIKWINYCYYHNQGQMIGLNAGFSALDETDVHFARYLAELSDGQQEVKPISEEFRLPSATALLTVEPAYLFEVRDSDIGESYFFQLASWRSNPTDDAARQLVEALRGYVAALNRVYLAKGKSIFNWQWYLKAHVPPAKSRWGELGRESLKVMAQDALGYAIPHIGLSSIVGQFAALTYEWMPQDDRDRMGPSIGIKTDVAFALEKSSERLIARRNNKDSLSEASFVKL